MNQISRPVIAIGAFSMAMAVILGALGAHALEEILMPEQLDSFKTGVRYQAWHSLALLFLGLGGNTWLNEKYFRIIIALFSAGIVFFSFSIYLLNLRSELGISGLAKVLGPITPIGGILLIIAWIMLGISASRRERKGGNSES